LSRHVRTESKGRHEPVSGFATFAFVSLLIAARAAHAQPPEHPPLGSFITIDALGVLPSPANLFSLLDTAVADVIADRIDTGGLSAGQAARVGAHGSTWTQTLFTLGDVDITDPNGTGTPLLLPGVDTWERVDVATGMMPIERSAPGLAIALSPRAPAAAWMRSIAVTLSPPGFNAKGSDEPPSISRLDSWLYGNVFVAGPIVDPKIRFLASVAATRSTHVERASPSLIDSNVASAFVNLTATPRATDEVRAIGWLQRARDPVAGHAALGQPNAGEKRMAFHGQAAWSHELADRDGGLRAYGGFTTRRRSNTLVPPSFAVVERLTDGPIPNLLDAGPGVDRLWSAGVRIHGGFVPAPASAPSPARLSMTAGIEASGASTTAQSTFAAVVGELIDGIPARVWQFTDPVDVSRWRSTTVAGYAGTTVALAPRLTIDGGLRMESIRGARNGEAAAISWRSLLPRAGAHLLITQTAQFAAFAQYGRYGHRLPLRDLAYGDPTAPTATISRWSAPVGATTLAPASIGPVFQRIGPGSNGDPLFSAIDPELRQPFMHEVILGFEARPFRSTFMRLAAIGRREHHLVGVVDTGVPASTYTRIGIPDASVDVIGAKDDQTLFFYNRSPATFGADRYLLTNPVEHDPNFVGADLAIQVRRSRLVMLMGITAGRSEALSANRGFGPLENDTALLGEVFINPNAATFAKGRVFTERGYTIKIASTFQMGHDVDVGLIARYQDGQHFARLVIMEGLNQGAEAVRAFPNGKTRFTFSGTLDARLQKALRAGGRRVTAIVDAYNLLNLAYEVEEFSVTGATSRLTSAVQPPRVVQVGLKLSF
jgi:hypothetical protein